MHRPYKVLLSTLVLSLTTAAGAEPVPTDTDKQQSEECPNAVRGVELSLKQVPGGVTLQFLAPDTSQRIELERMLREAGALVEYQSKLAALRPGQVLSHDGSAIPAVDIEVRPTKRGADVIIQAEQRSDAATVVAHAKSLKELWDGNACVHSMSVQST